MKLFKTSLIITIPVDGFNENLTNLKPDWENFLKNYKPVGVIFYTKHFIDKRQAKTIIQCIKKILKNECFLSIDQEGGRVQRLCNANKKEWYNCPSAEDLSNKYIVLSKTKGKKIARDYVISEYQKMFKDMREIGLNMTFGPNCDINFYKDKKEYKQCLEYKQYCNKDMTKIKSNEEKIYEEAMLFKDYLNSIDSCQKALNNPNLNEKDFKISEKNKSQIEVKINKLNLMNRFKKIQPYNGYINVIGNRSYGADPLLVAEMSKLFIEAAKKEKILCVPKHILGHGRVLKDTHAEDANISTKKNELVKSDLVPYVKLFKDKSLQFVMPSHIKYIDIDKENIATYSKKVLDFFEKVVKRKVIFISDDLGMHGASQYHEKDSKNSKKYPKRECDILLSGNGTSLDELTNLAKKNPIKNDLMQKLKKIWMK